MTDSDRRVPDIQICLPDWVARSVAEGPTAFSNDEEKMRFVLGLARQNVELNTGGPFAAAVFDAEHNRLMAAGVNLVVPASCSSAHAEIVALSVCQKGLGTFDLSGIDRNSYELVSSTEPCAMCQGAVVWSGVNRLVYGARGQDARDIGFDEGVKDPNWPARLRERGIDVISDVCRDEAVSVLKWYADRDGLIYNPERTER